MEAFTPQFTAGAELAGRFRLRRLLGRGGSAEVWAATDAALDTEIALKLWVARDPADAAALASDLQTDAERLRRLAHPGVLRPIVVVQDGTTVGLALELADGGHLGSLRGAGYQTIVTAVRDVAETLQYVHAQGITHGDLKAGNVLRDQRGRWRLTDFRRTAALATLTDAMSDETLAVSLSTVSPQQLDGGAATMADDLYSFGALVYDLLAGHPPLHPGITAERIRAEVPARLGVDGQGQTLPVALTRLVAVLLDKQPARRPGSIGAVRALLAEIAADSAAHGTRPAASGTGSGQSSQERPGGRARTRASGVPPPLLFGGLAVLLIAVLAVVVWLPRVVSERGPLVKTVAPVATAPAVETPPGAKPEQAAPAAPDLRTVADAALAERLRAEEAATTLGAARWGGADWLEARRLAELGDSRYRERDFAAATSSFKDAAGRFRALAEGAPAAFSAALQGGNDALTRGDQSAARAAFGRALSIRPNDTLAMQGLARSEQLDEILGQMAEGAAHETAGDLSAARADYAAVLKLDAAWAPARTALARIDAGLAAGEFERAMAQGLEALAAGRTAQARAALGRALVLRPGDPGARNALEQLNGDESRARLTALQAEAERLVAGEAWALAAAKYRALLDLDATLAVAKTGLVAAEARAALDQRMEKQLGNTDRFNDDAVAASAQSAVDEATAVSSPGPRLAAQISRLKEQLKVAANPVPVQFESDSLTNVVIYRVAVLGAFASRTVELRPGTYVVVGTRDGYRDVRQTVRIAATGNPVPITVRCEEPI